MPITNAKKTYADQNEAHRTRTHVDLARHSKLIHCSHSFGLHCHVAGLLSSLHFLFLTCCFPLSSCSHSTLPRHHPPQQPFEAFLPFLKQVTEFLEKLLTWPRSKLNGILTTLDLAIPEPVFCKHILESPLTFSLFFPPLPSFLPPPSLRQGHC